MEAVRRLTSLSLGLLAKRCDGYFSDAMGLAFSTVSHTALDLAASRDVPVYSRTKVQTKQQLLLSK